MKSPSWREVFLRNHPEIAQYPDALRHAVDLLERMAGPILPGEGNEFRVPVLKGTADAILVLLATPTQALFGGLDWTLYGAAKRLNPDVRTIRSLLQEKETDSALLCAVSVFLPNIGEDVCFVTPSRTMPFNLGLGVFFNETPEVLGCSICLPPFFSQVVGSPALRGGFPSTSSTQ